MWMLPSGVYRSCATVGDCLERNGEKMILEKEKTASSWPGQKDESKLKDVLAESYGGLWGYAALVHE